MSYIRHGYKTESAGRTGFRRPFQLLLERNKNERNERRERAHGFTSLLHSEFTSFKRTFHENKIRLAIRHA